MNKPVSANSDNYNILIRQRDDEFISYCPQLNTLFKGYSEEEVYEKMEEFIKKYISKLSAYAIE